MSESNEFRRGSAIVSPGFVIHIPATVLLINGASHLLSRRWIWGTVCVLVATMAWLNYAWMKRTPIIRVRSGEIVVLRHPFVPPKRVRVSDIQGLDESRPSVARLALTGGRECVIPLHWIDWDDRLRFLTFLKSALGSARV